MEVLIEPLHEGMNLVQVHAKAGLEDKIQTTPVFVSDSCLPILVRQKALQANVSCNSKLVTVSDYIVQNI